MWVLAVEVSIKEFLEGMIQKWKVAMGNQSGVLPDLVIEDLCKFVKTGKTLFRISEAHFSCVEDACLLEFESAAYVALP